jgi:hypothetical protein
VRTIRFQAAYAPALAAALLAAPLVVAPVYQAAAQIGIGLNITIAPPALPVYVQPPLPGPGYLWTPGYWAYGPLGYYWVPGTWVQPPSVGLLWTPGYWGWNNGVYIFNRGYWGPHVGFYGGINYGFGYVGTGFFGGEWRGGAFAYNSAYNNFGGVHVTNVYNRTVNVTNVTNIRNVSYNGPGGIQAKPTPEEQTYAHENHVQPTPVQEQHAQLASQNKALLASVNHGHPSIAATPRPAAFTGPGVVAAHEAAASTYRGANRGAYRAPAHVGGTAATPYHNATPYHDAAPEAARPAAVPHPAAMPHPAPAAAPHPAAHAAEKPHRR